MNHIFICPFALLCLDQVTSASGRTAVIGGGGGGALGLGLGAIGESSAAAGGGGGGGAGAAAALTKFNELEFVTVEGWLTKKAGASLTNKWDRRYCVLTQNQISYSFPKIKVCVWCWLLGSDHCSVWRLIFHGYV
jgi:hypothetical protein